jgi:hypothetical protein
LRDLERLPATEGTVGHQVSLCYSPSNENEASEIREELRDHGVNIWWDGDLPVGSNWAEEVGRALAESDSMIVLVSPDAMASDLVKRELDHAVASDRYRRRVFPVFIQPTYAVPWYFRRLKFFDLTKDRSRRLSEVAAAVKSAS